MVKSEYYEQAAREVRYCCRKILEEAGFEVHGDTILGVYEDGEHLVTVNVWSMGPVNMEIEDVTPELPPQPPPDRPGMCG